MAKYHILSRSDSFPLAPVRVEDDLTLAQAMEFMTDLEAGANEAGAEIEVESDPLPKITWTKSGNTLWVVPA